MLPYTTVFLGVPKHLDLVLNKLDDCFALLNDIVNGKLIMEAVDRMRYSQDLIYRLRLELEYLRESDRC